MPEIGRPTTQQEMQYRQVEMGPKSLAGKGMSESPRLPSRRGCDQAALFSRPAVLTTFSR
jgi:hypothetical protein